MQIVRVFKPQTERKNFFGVGWCSKFRSQTERQKILRAKGQETVHRERTDSSVVQSFYHTKEEAWEDFDEHSQQ